MMRYILLAFLTLSMTMFVGCIADGIDNIDNAEKPFKTTCYVIITA